MAESEKIISLPVIFITGTLEGTVDGVVDTVNALGQTVYKTGSQGSIDVYDLWKNKKVHIAAKVVASPFAFVLGTVKGAVTGVASTAKGVCNTATGALTGGTYEVIKSFKDDKN